MTYFIVTDDSLRGEYLVVGIIVDGRSWVVGRFDERADAQREAEEWTALEEAAA